MWGRGSGRERDVELRIGFSVGFGDGSGGCSRGSLPLIPNLRMSETKSECQRFTKVFTIVTALQVGKIKRRLYARKHLLAPDNRCYICTLLQGAVNGSCIWKVTRLSLDVRNKGRRWKNFMDIHRVTCAESLDRKYIMLHTVAHSVFENKYPKSRHTKYATLCMFVAA